MSAPVLGTPWVPSPPAGPPATMPPPPALVDPAAAEEDRKRRRRDELIALAQERAGRGRGVTDWARWMRCDRCKAWTAWGLDSDSMAFEVHVDPAALSPAGEIVALAIGYPTYSLDVRAGRLQINRRDEYRIAGDPAGTLDRGDVVTRHRCVRDPRDPKGFLGLPWIPRPWPSTGPLATETRLPDLRARRSLTDPGDPPY